MGIVFSSFTECAEEIYEWAKGNGFWDIRFVDEPTNPNSEIGHLKASEKLALIHSEVSEALECLRDGEMLTEYKDDGKPVGFASELADILIRTLDLAAAYKIDIGLMMEEKMTYNRTRPYKNGKAF